MYIPSEVSGIADIQELHLYLAQELNQISLAFQRVANGELLETLHNEPAKPRDGLFALADGTDWNPGSGAGAYCYYAGAWHFLG